MKVMVVGSGGREHALVWKFYQSEKADKIYAAPGNDGLAELAELVDIDMTDTSGLADFARKNEIDLTVVGPEEPLVAGIVDEFQARGLKIFGPTREAAMLEGSKVFAKQILTKYNIPTADFEVFTDPSEAISYLKNIDYPRVIKAEGLAGGQGTKIVTSRKEAIQAVNRIMEDRIFGDAGERIVVENFLTGQEISIMALTDGEILLPLAASRDHKPIFDGDEGPNTAGMGAYSPVPYLSEAEEEEIYRQIMRPTLKALREEDINYQGVLYAGLILTSSGPKVLEFNARFGDPESQAVLPRLKDDLLAVIEEIVEGRLDRKKLSWCSESAVCVVLTAGGYPLTYEEGDEIFGLVEVNRYDNLLVFHAGTRKTGDKFVTSGGRVLNLTILADGLFSAINQVYEHVEEIDFRDMHYRSDIGRSAIQELDSGNYSP